MGGMNTYLPNPVPTHEGKPFVYLNAALSLDGKLAPASRFFEPFTNIHDVRMMHLLRTRADAVMAGMRTLENGQVTMGSGGRNYEAIRLREGRPRCHLRVVVSGSGKVRTDLPIFQTPHSPIILLTTHQGSEQLPAYFKGKAEIFSCGEISIDWNAALGHLRYQWGVHSLLCEGGGELNGSLIKAGVVDEIYITMAPVIFGGRNAPTLADGSGFLKLSEASQWKNDQKYRRGNCLFLRYKKSMPDRIPTKRRTKQP